MLIQLNTRAKGNKIPRHLATLKSSRLIEIVCSSIDKSIHKLVRKMDKKKVAYIELTHEHICYLLTYVQGPFS